MILKIPSSGHGQIKKKKYIPVHRSSTPVHYSRESDERLRENFSDFDEYNYSLNLSIVRNMRRDTTKQQS